MPQDSGAAFAKQCWLFPAKKEEEKEILEVKYSHDPPRQKKCMLPVLQNGGQKLRLRMPMSIHLQTNAAFRVN